MKKTLFYLTGCLCAIVGATDLQAQVTYKIKADSVKITNDNCSAELIIENSTRNVDGFLYNTGNGRTRFKSEEDPSVPSYIKTVSLNDINNWNAAFSWGNPQGNYPGIQQFLDSIAALRSASNLFFLNGLTKAGNDVKLGGVITETVQLVSLNSSAILLGSSDAAGAAVSTITTSNNVIQLYQYETTQGFTNRSFLMSSAGFQMTNSSGGAFFLTDKYVSIGNGRGAGLILDSAKTILQNADSVLMQGGTVDIRLNSSGAIISDHGYAFGAKYREDYSAKGMLDDRWIPDWGTVKSLLGTASAQFSSKQYIKGETPAGIINGTNKVFTLLNTPVVGTVSVFLNGLFLDEGSDYVVNGNSIETLVAPASSSKLRVTYFKQ